MKFRFIDQHRTEFRIRVMCRVLEVSVSGYYAWRKRPISQREEANQELVQQIKAIHKQSHKTYGSPRMWAELRANGHNCNRKRVARLMRLHHVQPKRRRRYKTTTQSKHAYPVAANELNRYFNAEAPNLKWVADITYVPTGEGWLYLAAIMDLFSRQIVGWAMGSRITAELTCTALQMALATRQPGADLLHHSDRGSQYASHDYQALLQEHGIRVSMSRSGDCYDNAVMESFFGTLKSELLTEIDHETRQQAKTAIFAYIEAFYNRYRRHSFLDYLSPEEFERRYHVAS